MLDVRCSECGRVYGSVDAEPLGELCESHGLCPTCAAEYERRLEEEMEQRGRSTLYVNDRSLVGDYDTEGVDQNGATVRDHVAIRHIDDRDQR